MKNYALAVCGWIFFFIGLNGVGFVIRHILYPYILRLVSEYSGKPAYMTMFVKGGIFFFLIFFAVIFFHIFFTKTETGRKWKKWFVHINKITFWSGR